MTKEQTIALLFGICVSLLIVLAYLLFLQPTDPLPVSAVLQNPEARQEAIEQLAARSSGVYDSHVDPDVGRVLLPSLQRPRLSTNRFGLNERDYAFPKPQDMVRVVILGDSMVYGLGALAEDRLGVHLEHWLHERAPDFADRLEVLHFGLPSWNIKAEVSYLRRQLSELLPDLVIHIIVPNDLAPSAGVRGFGAKATFSSQERHRADSHIGVGHPRRVLGFKRTGYLRYGIDYESQHRYQAAVADLHQLGQTIERLGAKYRVLVHHRHANPIAWNLLGRHLKLNHVIYLARSFANDKTYWVSDADPHWNRAGHRKVAQLLYGLIVRDGLLPQVPLPVWDEAAQTVEDIATVGEAEAARPLTEDERLTLGGRIRLPPIAASLDFEQLNDFTAAQVHGGLDKHGYVSPYASFLLKNAGGTQLRIEGQTFPRPELDGARVHVFVDAEEVGAFEIEAATPLDLVYRVPESVLARPYLSIRFAASDYVYQGKDLQHCVVFQLKRLALESDPPGELERRSPQFSETTLDKKTSPTGGRDRL